MVDKAAEFRAQLERRRAQRTAVPQAQPQSQGFAPQAQAASARAAAPVAAPAAAASAAAAPAAPAAVSAAPAVASSDVKAKLSNPAALQRGWQTALADLKRQRAAYGALLLSARIVAEPDASGIAIEFSPENSFAFSAAQKPDITAAIESALSASFGGPVPFRVTQGSVVGGAVGATPAAARATASVASAPAPMPTASAPAVPAVPAAVHRARQSVRAQAPSAGPSRQAPQAVAAPPWEDDVVPYTDADIAAYMPEGEQPPFTEPDASLTAGAPSHREAASQSGEPAVFAKPAKNNPFAGRKMPEGIGRGVSAQPEATAQATESTVSSSAGQAPKTAPESAPAKKRKTAADKLAEAVAEFGDAMLVVGPDPVDPFPVALELGFDSAPDPKKKAKGMVKPKGWPMPQDAKLLEGRDLDALREGCDGGQEGEGQESSSDSLSSGQSLQPAPVAAAEAESRLAPVAEPEFPAEPPAPIPAPPSRPNPFANRAMPQGIGGGQGSREPVEYAGASAGASGEMSVEEIFASFGVNMNKVTEER